MKKYFIYARTACKEQNEKQDKTDQQVEKLREHAKTNGLEIIEVVKDFSSGIDPNRSAFQEMVVRLNSGEGTGILCTSIDRLARNYLTLAQLMKLIEVKDIEIVTPERTYKKTAEDQLVLTLMTTFAEFYAKSLAERVQRAKLQTGKQDR